MSDDKQQRAFFKKAQGVVAKIADALDGEPMNVAAFSLAFAVCQMVESLDDQEVRDEARFYASQGSQLGVARAERAQTARGARASGSVH